VPRRSSDSLAIVSPRRPYERLAPPKHRPARARKVFIELVLTKKPDYFEPSDLPLLARYAECSALAEEAAAGMAKDPVVDGKASPWIGIHATMTKAMSALSMRLRLSPQARQPNRPTRPVQISYYDQMRLENGNDDGDRQASTGAGDQDGTRGKPGPRWAD
jgi:hypothetical protein